MLFINRHTANNLSVLHKTNCGIIMVNFIRQLDVYSSQADPSFQHTDPPLTLRNLDGRVNEHG